MKTILITGGGGFLGGFVVDEFLSHGYKVRAAVRRQSDLSRLKQTGVEIVFADITNTDEIDQALQGVDEVVHVAALLGAGGRKKEDLFETNYEATKNLAQSCIKKSIKRLTFISSIAAVGPTRDKNRMLTENSPANPNGFYGESKQEAEKYLLSEIDRNKLEIVIIRPALIYGPRDKKCAASYFRIANLGFFPLPTPSDNKASFIYVTDAAKAIFTAHTQSPPGETYMLATEVATFKEFGQKLLSTKPKGLKLLIPIPRVITIMTAFAADLILNKILKKSPDIGKRIRRIGSGNWAVDNSKIKKLGFAPQIHLEEGLRKTWDFYSKNKELLNIKYLLKNP